MNRLLTTIILVLSILAVASITVAEVPLTINYQGYLTDDAGDPLTGSHDIIFTICSDSGNGSSLPPYFKLAFIMKQ